MKKHLLFFIPLFFCFSFPSFSQFEFGATVFPNYNQAIIRNTGDVPLDIEELFRELETGAFSFSAGLSARRWLYPSGNIYVSIQYAQINYQNKEKELRWPSGETGLIHFKHVHHYLEFPIGFQQRIFGEDRFSFSSSIGTSIRYAYKNEGINTVTEEGEKKVTRIDRQFNYLGQDVDRRILFPIHFSLQFHIPMGARFVWEVGPSIAYEFQGLFKPEGLNRNLLQMGVTNSFWIN